MIANTIIIEKIIKIIPPAESEEFPVVISI